MTVPAATYRVLALDGGGAKGFYTLGVLREVEAMLSTPLHERFDLIFGTSTGAIIATLIALGHSIDEIYRAHVPTVMSRKTRRGRTEELGKLASTAAGATDGTSRGTLGHFFELIEHRLAEAESEAGIQGQRPL